MRIITYGPKKFVTHKKNLSLNIGKLNDNYRYKDNLFNKKPKILKLISKKNNLFDDSKNNSKLFLFDFPVEKVIIDMKKFKTVYNRLENFYDTKYLELTSNVKSVEIINNIGLSDIKDIKIPYTISNFENKYIENNNISSLTIFNNTDNLILDLNECLNNNSKMNIIALNNDDKLNINITSNNFDIEYDVYLKDGKLTYDKKYNKFEINANEDRREELNIIELKNLYNEIDFKGKFYNVEKVILNKSSINYLEKDMFNFCQLKEIIIKDDNEMSLLPRTVDIKVDINNYEQFNTIEVLDNKLLVSININSITPKKYIIVDQNLNVINLGKYIKTVILDYNTNNFKYENNILTIPFNMNFNTIDSKIITSLLLNSNKIYVRYKGKEILIPKSEPSYDGYVRGIECYRSKDFCVTYYEYVNGRKVYKQENYVLYKYDEDKKTYIDSYNEFKKLIKKT